MQLTGYAILLRLLNNKQHIIYGISMVCFCLSSIGRKGYFGQTDTLLVVLEKYRLRLYKNT